MKSRRWRNPSDDYVEGDIGERRDQAEKSGSGRREDQRNSSRVFKGPAAKGKATSRGVDQCWGKNEERVDWMRAAFRQPYEQSASRRGGLEGGGRARRKANNCPAARHRSREKGRRTGCSVSLTVSGVGEKGMKGR